MPITYVHMVPAIAGFHHSEDRATLLQRLEDSLIPEEQVFRFQYDEDEGDERQLTVMFDIQMYFSEEECDGEDPSGETIRAWELKFSDHLSEHFALLTFELLDDAAYLLDCVQT